MPLYFLHLHDGEQIVEDDEGLVLPDAATAIEEARAAARDILAEKIKRREIVDGQVIIVCDENGSEISTVRFSDEIRLPAGSHIKLAAE